MKFKYLYIIILILALIPFANAAAPVADFTSNVTSGSTPLPVQFNDSSTWTPIGWAWYFGDDNWSTKAWVQMSTATEFTARENAASVVLPNGSILIMGGYGGSIYRNDTWISVNNGTNWTSVNASCGWQGKGSPGAAVLSDGSILIMGGYNTVFTPPYSNDTWRSTDNGKTWTRMNASSGWKARSAMATVALTDGSVILMGGYDGGTFRDIWKSSDNGLTWTNITGTSVWGTRRYPEARLMPNNSILLTGGSNLNDTWISINGGGNWTQVSANAPWLGRESFGSAVMPDGSFIITSGFNTITSAYYNDTWKSSDYGKTWTQVNASNPVWMARRSASIFENKPGSLVIVGGYTSLGTRLNDVYQLNPAESVTQNPVHTYAINGKYNVSLRAFNADGWGDIQKPEYITLGILTASFTANNTTGYAPFAVKFNDTSNENPTIWLWNFTNATGNNTNVSFSNAQNVTYTFGIGNFSIKLTASNFAGNSTSTQNTWINVSKYPPLTSFTSNYTTPGNVYPLVIKFNDTTLYLPTTWNWSFGDGRWLNTTNSTIVNTTYQYAVAGKYNVSLLTNNTAGSNTSTRNEYINLTSDDDANVTSWLHMNGTNGSTTFTGEKGVAWTTNGGAIISTLSPKYGGASGYFPTASSSYLSTPNSSSFQFGTGDFTIEMWVNVTSVSGTNDHIISKTNNPRTQGWGLDRTNSTAGDSGWDFWMGNDSVGQAFFNAPIPNKTWTHIAVERISGTLYLYINGNLTAIKAGYNANYDTSDPVWIGRQQSNYYNGFIDEFRISKGIARWTSNFTPPFNEYRGTLETTYPDVNPNSTFRYKTNPGGIAYIDNITQRNRTVQIENITNTSYVVGSALFDSECSIAKSVQLNLSTYSTGMVLVSSSIDNINGIVEFNISRPAGFNNGTSRASIVDFTLAYVNYSDVHAIPNYFGYGYLINGTTNKVYAIHNFLNTAPTFGDWNFTANFTANNLTTPMGLPVEFVSTFNGSYPNRWNWSFGDGYFDNGTNSTTTHTFTSTGLKTIVLTESLWQNASIKSTITKTDYILVGTAPESSFTANQSFGTAPMVVEFNDTSTGDITSWNWSFNGGSFVVDPNVTVLFSFIGNYTVTLNVSSIFGDSSSTQYINVSYVPITNFTMSNQSGNIPLVVEFTDDSAYGPIIAWNWSFGDGNYSDIARPTHIYTGVGNYNVTLYTANIFGTNATSHYVNTTGHPIANFSMSNVTSNSPLVVNFTDNSLNFPTSWNWSFGDGNYSNNKDVIYVYAYTGNYTVILNATNAAGSNSTIKYANSTENIPPIASFTMSNISSSPPLVVNFTDTSLNFPTAWNWSFGDGNYSEEHNPIYIFSEQGNYTVILNASNFVGNGYTSHYVEVLGPPTAQFTTNTQAGADPLTVNFTDASLMYPTAWNWSFNDVLGNNTEIWFSTLQNPDYTFNIGNFSIKLNASNIYGYNITPDDYWINVSLVTLPNASFTSISTGGPYPPLNIQFNDTSLYFPTSWNWSFGDGNVSNEQNPLYVYTFCGNFSVLLRVENTAGADWKNTTDYIILPCAPIPIPTDERIAMRMADIGNFVVIAAIILTIALVATFIYMWAKRRS